VTRLWGLRGPAMVVPIWRPISDDSAKTGMILEISQLRTRTDGRS